MKQNTRAAMASPYEPGHLVTCEGNYYEIPMTVFFFCSITTRYGVVPDPSEACQIGPEYMNARLRVQELDP